MALAVCVLSSCTLRDEMSDPADDSGLNVSQTASGPGLVQQDNGTWKADGVRIPLVGPGRIVNTITSALVSVAGSTGSLDPVVDTDLSNFSEINPSLLGAKVTEATIVSVKDIYRTYSSGQSVGFVYSENSGLLELDILKSFGLRLYNDGQEVQKIDFSTEAGLGLDLLSVNGKDGVDERVISAVAEKSFDEVRFVSTGVDVSALTPVSVRYAFVGDNPEIRMTSETAFSDFWTGGNPVCDDERTEGYGVLSPESWSATDNPVNGDPTDCSSIDAPILNITGKSATYAVDMRRSGLEGYEAGFCYEAGELLGIGLLGSSAPALYGYDAEGNKTVESVSGTGLLAVGVAGASGKAYVSTRLEGSTRTLQMKYDFGNVSIGGKLEVYYGYVRKAVGLDPSSYFNMPSGNFYGNSISLPEVTEGSVVYELVSQPYKGGAAIEGNVLAGADRDGAYVIRATYTAPGNLGTIVHESVFYRYGNNGPGTGCNNYITADSHGAYATEAVGWQGSLLDLFANNTNPDAVVDSDPENYADRGGLLSLAQSEPVIAVAMTKPVELTGKEMRVGFIIQPNAALLNTSLLSDLSIRLYNGNVRVDNGDVQDGGVLGLDLLGGSSGRVRVSTVVSSDFDRMELWCSNALSLLDYIRVYGAFYEDAECTSGPAADVCMEVMSDLTHGLKIDYADSGSAGLATVGATIDNVGAVLDQDLTTGMETGQLVALASDGVSIALDFRRHSANQSIGIVLEDGSGLLSLDLLQGLSVTVKDGDVDVLKDYNFGGLLDIGLLRKDRYVFLEVVPDKEYDNIVLKFGSALLDAGLGSSLKVMGLYTRVDENGDGIPDCSQQDMAYNAGFMQDEYRICQGSDLQVQIATDAPVGTSFAIEFENTDDNNTFIRNLSLSVAADGSRYFLIKGLQKGRYRMTLYSYGSAYADKADLYVHPVLTRWTGAAGNRKWSNWDNWSDGSPWTCTDVVVGTSVYGLPVVSDGDCCRDLHFEEGGAATGLDFLDYRYAFVEKTLTGGVEHWMSVPLEETFTGDMFINDGIIWGEDKYFTVMDSGNYPEKRVNPVVYQRLYGGQGAYEMDSSGERVIVESAEWTAEFNGVALKYAPAQGFCMRTGNDGVWYRFNFPKNHSEYSYYAPDGSGTGLHENIDRVQDLVGRLYGGDVSVQVSGSSLVGNPYMAYLDIKKIFDANPWVQSLIYKTSAGVKVTVTAQYGSLQYVPEADVDCPPYISPMQAFMANGNGQMHLNDGMQGDPADMGVTGSDVYGMDYIRVVLSRAGHESAVMLYEGNDVSSIKYIYTGMREPEAEIYLVDRNDAMSVMPVNGRDEISLGTLVTYPVNAVMDITVTNGMSGKWEMVDSSTGAVLGLEEGTIRINVRGIGSGTDRFYFRRR